MAEKTLYDVDVHHMWDSPAELIRYAPKSWREYLTTAGIGVPSLFFSRAGGTIYRLDAHPENGRAPGSDYETLRTQLLDEHKISRAVLTFNIGREEGFHNPAIAPILCRAANDYTIEEWLSRDDRLFGLAMIPMTVPDEAVKEIERVASHPRIAGVLILDNSFRVPLGHPLYHPIYAAAIDHGLPLVTHVNGDGTSKSITMAAGLPSTKPEYYTLLEQPAMSHMGSFLAGGVFERFPALRILFNEYGCGWVPWAMWGLDARYRELKREIPTLRMLPSEYFRRHVWLSTQPFDPPSAATFVELLETFGGLEDRLCFASDYPHWDCDNPAQVSSKLPAAWRPKVFAENAARFFGWDEPPAGSRERADQALAH